MNSSERRILALLLKRPADSVVLTFRDVFGPVGSFPGRRLQSDPLPPLLLSPPQCPSAPQMLGSPLLGPSGAFQHALHQLRHQGRQPHRRANVHLPSLHPHRPGQISGHPDPLFRRHTCDQLFEVLSELRQHEIFDVSRELLARACSTEHSLRSLKPRVKADSFPHLAPGAEWGEIPVSFEDRGAVIGDVW